MKRENEISSCIKPLAFIRQDESVVALSNCLRWKIKIISNFAIIASCHQPFRCNLFSFIVSLISSSTIFIPRFDSFSFVDDSYKRRAIEISHSFRNRLSNPLETAVFWVEYVAENGGNLLQSYDAVKKNSLNYLSLDVIMVLLCSIAVTIVLIIKAIRSLTTGKKMTLAKNAAGKRAISKNEHYLSDYKSEKSENSSNKTEKME